VLAEFKKASPSKGDIAAGLDAPRQALAYALAGACTISVLTEPTWFKGSLADLENVRSALEGATLSPGVCALRKDFLIDEYMLLEARAHGADTALLIVAILTPEELVRLMAASRALGMEPLVEVNTEAEMQIALDAGAAVIGVNNRNLHTFEVDMGTTGRLAAMIPEHADVQLLALSGVATRQARWCARCSASRRPPPCAKCAACATPSPRVSQRRAVLICSA
jgi:anthranilate synthase/indole-3-glycerol phosphate synthase/phosphoribosylanthranilate isomerase